MSERTTAPQSLEYERKAAEMIDYYREKAEVLALFESDEIAARALAELKEKRLLAERADPESEVTKTIRGQIDALTPQDNGELQPEGKELLGTYRDGVKEMVIEIGIKGETDGLAAQYGHERSLRMIEHHRKLAEQSVMAVQPGS